VALDHDRLGMVGRFGSRDAEVTQPRRDGHLLLRVLENIGIASDPYHDVIVCEAEERVLADTDEFGFIIEKASFSACLR